MIIVLYCGVRILVLNTPLNNLSVISCRTDLLVKKATDLPEVIDKLYHMLYGVHIAMGAFEITTLVLMGTDCTGRCRFHYHTIMNTAATFVPDELIICVLLSFALWQY